MGKLSFDSGIVSYDVNGVPGAVQFNPTDAAFFSRIRSAVEELEVVCESTEKQIKEKEDPAESYQLMDDLDRQVETRIDGLFNSPGLCSQIFANNGIHVSPNAIADGFPLWVNFLLAVYDEADESVKKQQKIANEKILKYTKKYKK